MTKYENGERYFYSHGIWWDYETGYSEDGLMANCSSSPPTAIWTWIFG